jgi:hypothetical protein
MPPRVTYAWAEKAVPADANFILALLAKSLILLILLERGLEIKH